MKVILRKDQDKLGQVGAVVDVKDGYARNYLIPKGIAYPASNGSMRALTGEKKQAERRSTKELKTSEKLAAELEKLSGAQKRYLCPVLIRQVEANLERKKQRLGIEFYSTSIQLDP